MEEKVLNLISMLGTAMKNESIEKMTDIMNQDVTIDWDFVEDDIRDEYITLSTKAEKMIYRIQNKEE